MVWNYVAIWVITTLISYALAPRPEGPKPAKFKDIEVPSVDEGRDIPVVFGRMRLAPHVAWYGNFSKKAIKEGGKK